MKRWMKLAASLLLVAAVVALLGSRLYIKSNYAHLTVDGRVTDDFKLYFGPKGRILVDVARRNELFVYWPSAPQFISFCFKNDVIFARSVALTKHHPPKCGLSEGFMGGTRATDHSLTFEDNDRHKYEVTWQAPPR